MGGGQASSSISFSSSISVSSQTVADIERGWILANKEQHRQLKSLQEKVSKKEVRSIFPLPMQCESIYITLFHSQLAGMKFIHPKSTSFPVNVLSFVIVHPLGTNPQVLWLSQI